MTNTRIHGLTFLYKSTLSNIVVIVGMIASGPYTLVTQRLKGRFRCRGQRVGGLMIIHHFLFQQLS
jgi:hypothetical protein